MKSKKIIVANWKMNPRTPREARSIFQKIKRTANALTGVRTIICPPFVFLGTLHSHATTVCALGAQDVFWKNTKGGVGAYTGKVSPAQLYSLGVSHVILGHSEQRALGETNETIQKKIKASFEYRLNVILCVGEIERDSRGYYLSFLKDEIKKSLGKISGKELKRLLIAYEPIWAVGAHAKRADTPEALLEIVIFIRKVLSDIYGKSIAFKIPILYGGSVDAGNAHAFLKNGGVQGLLVGRASLNPREFNEILKIAQRIK
ncbi:MAG: triosephosphate isomerase [Parcubacteria group bacterium]|nr:triosephosphate isomerase [Parcubacteria group bacterium]